MALKDHAEKIVFALALLGSGGFVAMEMMQTEPESFKQLDASKKAINDTLTADGSGKVSPKYPYSADAASKLAQYKDLVNRNLTRTDKDLASIPTFVAYQRPSKPTVDKEINKPIADDELTSRKPAKIGQIEKVEARPDHGRIFISFRLPHDMEDMDVVRVEIFRGEAEDKIDLKTPYGTIEFEPEDPTPVVDDTNQPNNNTPVNTGAENLSTAEKRRREMGLADAPKDNAPKDEGKKVALDIPAEYAGVQVFKDTHVDAKRTYYYQLKLVSRMKHEPNSFVDEKDQTSGKLLKRTVFTPPTDGTPVAPKQGNSKLLFGTPLTQVVSATPPANFEIRLSGSDESGGKIPPVGTPDYRLQDYHGYKGVFAVRVWVKEAQDWYNITIQAGQDERLKGTLNYKTADTRENKSVDFDTGYTLKEVRWAEEVKKVKEPKQVFDDKGNPVMENGKPKLEYVEKDGEKIPNEVAVLKDNTTGKLEEFPKRSDFALRDKAVEIYRKLAEESEAQHKKDQEARKIAVQKAKERNEARKQQELQNQQNQQNQVNPGGFGPPAGPGGGPSGPPPGMPGAPNGPQGPGGGNMRNGGGGNMENGNHRGY